MAITKTLNTKIALRYDSYENWITNDPVLMAGELALAAISVKQDGAVEHVPSVLIKCGDGTHKYSELDYVFAKAADVISAAKSETALTAFVNNVIAGAGIATDEAMTALAGRVTTAEGEIDALQGLVGDTKVATQISNAITALNLADTYDSKGSAAAVQTALDNYKTSNDTVIAGIKTGNVINDFASVETELGKKETAGAAAQALVDAKAYADGKDTAIAAAKSAADAAQADVDALEAKVGIVPDDKTVVQMISEAQTAATYDDTEVRGLISDNTDAIGALETLVGDTAVATQISTAVSGAKAELIGKDTDTATSATIAGAKKYADSLEAAMDARVDALEAAVGAGGSVSAQITAEIQKLDKEDTAVDGQYVSAVSETDGVITVTRATLPDYTDVYAPKTHNHAISDVTGLQDALDGKAAATDVTALSGKVTTLVGADADKSVRTIANEELAAQLIPENAKESLNTLQEIAAWIQSHPDDASAMNTKIGNLETLVGDTSVASQVGAETDRAKAAEKVNADAITALDGRLTTAEGEIDTLQTNVATNTSDIATLKGTGEGSVAKAVSDAVAALDVEDTAIAHQVVTAVSETDGKIAVTRAQLTTDDIAAGTEVWIFDCGDSSNAV